MLASWHPLAEPAHHLPSVSIATYLPDRHLCLFRCPRGKLLHTMSHHANKQHLLHVEEALYLLEHGLLELLYDEVPVSVQECYALMEVAGVGWSEAGGGVDAYMVYAELKAQGWVVLRPAALHREKRPPPPPLPPPETASEQQEADSAATDASDGAEHEAQTTVSHLDAVSDEPPESAVQMEWTELEWGCADEDERGLSSQLLQPPFIAAPTDTRPTATLASSLLSTLSPLPLFFLWPPSTVRGFRRSSPPRPSHLLIVGSGSAEDQRLAAVLRTTAGMSAVWQRAEREMRGDDGKGELVVAIRGMPVLLATVHLTRVSYMQFGPLS